MSLSIIQVLEDRNLLGQFLRDPETWAAWFAFLRAFFALEPTPGDHAIYSDCTGRTEWPSSPASETWVVAGRRSGKSFTIALLATFLAAFRKYQLSAGEMAHVVIVAPTRAQAGIIRSYISGFFEGNDILRPMVVRETGGEIELSNRVSITILSSDYRSVRGYSAVACIVDEVAFLQSDGATPDAEVIRALRPCLATTGGPLICISSPYSRQGALYAAWKAHFGKEGDPILVWQAASTRMNPTLSAEAIYRAMKEDPAGAEAEWNAVFRSDVETFVSQEAAEACIVPGRFELPPLSHLSYTGFVDPSGGSADSFTLAVSHVEKDTRILDAVRERRPPFSPEKVVEEYATLLKAYNIAVVVGDRYAGEWPREQFRKHGIDYRPSERTKSELYLELLAPLNSGHVELLDHERLLSQLCRLERRTARSGKDSVDHGPGAASRDDLINSACGALVSARAAGELNLDNIVMIDTGHVGIGLLLRELPDDPGEWM